MEWIRQTYKDFYDICYKNLSERNSLIVSAFRKYQGTVLKHIFTFHEKLARVRYTPSPSEVRADIND